MVLELSIEVNGSTYEGLEKGAREIVKHVRPDWKDTELTFKTYTDGITNKLIGVCGENNGDQVLVRVYGNKTELFIDRSAETRNMQILHKAGCGTELYAIFKNGLCYEFIKGKPLEYEDILKEEIWRSIAKKMATMHKIKDNSSEVNVCISRLHQFLDIMPDVMTDAEKQKRLNALGFTKENICKLIDELENHLKALHCPTVLCHNDLLLPNIVWNDTKKDSNFIDYEYAALNYQPVDIANHFNEFAGAENVDYQKYPSKEYQVEWLRCYLAHYNEVSEASVSDDEIELWYVWVNKCCLPSHLLWGIWAFLQAEHSSIDFNFLEYGVTRLQEYQKRKDEVFSLSHSNQ
ncbi:unnamed protein product [Meganyctiphanes norvegica]|uniref:ethanolamine kinase n=1 Tax=Meganyctiphanes norvegica TaxID=48144 RepID=A0AAV2R2W8_MEGNR